MELIKSNKSHVLKDEQEREKGIAKNIKEKETELYTLKKDFALRKFKESEQFYNELKLELEKEIVSLQQEMGNTYEKISNLDFLLDNSLSFLSNLHDSWVSNDVRTKKEMQNILFPEGVPYNYKTREYLTTKTNEYFELVTSFSVPYDETKKEIPTFSGEDSCIVAREGVEPSTSGL